MKKFVWILFAAALTLLSCQKQERTLQRTPGEVRFTTSIDRYTVKATDTAFEAGDQVGIFASAPISVNNVKAAVSGTSLNPETAIRWVEEDNSIVSFYAYYPYAAGVAKAYPFTVAANQSAIADYKKSDLMIAAAKSAQTENAIALNFHHALSKVAISIDNQLPGVTVSQVMFRNVALGATVDLETGAVSAVSTDLKNVIANANGGGYQLLIVPQTAQPEVQVTLSTGAAVLYKLDAAFTFGAGKKATATLVVKEAPAVNFSFEVMDWDEEQEPIQFDEGTDLGDGWVVLGLGGNWDEGVGMIRTSEFDAEQEVWEADITYHIGDEFKLRNGKIWAGMKEGWTYYGTGIFDGDQNYLDATEFAGNIILEGAGVYHLEFSWPSCWFVVTKTGEVDEPEPPQPAEGWKVMGLGGNWDYAAGQAMTLTSAEGAEVEVWEADITYAEGDEFKLSDNSIWAGMKPGWDYYGTGIFEGDQNYLDATNAANNIKFEGAGEYHLEFSWPTCWFVVTKIGEGPEPEPQPSDVVWKVRGLGEDWSWDAGIVMTCTTPGENPGEGVWEADITFGANDRFKLSNAADGGIWCGMKEGWTFYGLGVFEGEEPSNYLDATDAGSDIVIGEMVGEDVQARPGKYHLEFTWPSCWFVITEIAAE